MQNLQIIENQNQRVLTTQQLAEVYETDANNIQVNFKNHKSNFIEGVHYLLLQGEELKEFKSRLNNIQLPIEVSKFASSLYLWTERGANRHCKILDTDKAWEQFDNLEDTYFEVKQIKPLSAMEMMKLQFTAMAELDERVDTLEDKVDKQITLDHGQQRTLQNVVSKRAYERVGQVFPMDIKENVGKFFSAIYKDLKNRFGVASYRDVLVGDYNNAIQYVKAWIEPSELRG